MDFQFSILNFQFSVIDTAGAIIGLFYIVSEYRAGRWFWPLSLLMSAFYAFIDFTNGIFANGAICVYNFIMSVYGILVWRGILGRQKKSTSNEGRKNNSEKRQITSCPSRNWLIIVPSIVLLSVLLTWLLGFLNESQYPVLDGISSAITIVGMVMLAQKWWQQWFCWLLVEPMMMVIFWLTGNYASVILYAVFELFCFFGIIRWRSAATLEP